MRIEVTILGFVWVSKKSGTAPINGQRHSYGAGVTQIRTKKALFRFRDEIFQENKDNMHVATEGHFSTEILT